MELLKRLCLLTLLANSIAVDRNNFKTCDQSSFCRRCRHLQPDHTRYMLNLDSLQVSNDNIKVELINTEEKIPLNLKLTSLVDNTFRLEVEEANGLRPRYRSNIALQAEPVTSDLAVVNRDVYHLEVKSGSNTVKLFAKPFQIDFFSDNILVASINSRGLFNFEHYRHKREENENNPDSADNAELDSNPKDDPGMWEENFKSFRDTKPYGPSAVAVDVTFPGAAHAYGIPEHADSLVLKDTKDKTDPYRLYNLDVFEYELYNPMAIYGSIPFLYAHGQKKTVGFFWNNPSETWVDITSTSNTQENVVKSFVNFVSGNTDEKKETKVDTHFMSEAGVMDIFVFLGPNPKDIIKQYTKITGVYPLPQYFTIGYHQSRWNYNDEGDVQYVSDNFDHYDMPMDVIWLDIEYTNQKKYFTWDPIRFQHPKEMQQNLTAQGRKLVVIIDPHIKRESGYFLHETALSQNYYINNAEGNVYEGWCWPGASSYLDFFNPEVLDYYSGLYSLESFPESTNDMYLWNDMNEPSVFNGPEVTMPKDCIHFGNWEHREVHNLYGLMQVQGTYDGLLKRSKMSRRPFILTRAFYAGSQRFAAVWTGDNSADWTHLAISIPMCLTIGIAGIPMCGADVGGFFGNPDTELLVRWYQTGAFLPFFRAHAHIDTKRREPYLFPHDTRSVIRTTLRKRYSFLPYWYTLFFEHELTGLPVIRPLFMEYPEDSKIWTVDSTYLVGSALLVHPVTSAGATNVDVVFPGNATDLWYDIDTYKSYNGDAQTSIPVDINKIPVYQRAGTIIPKKERVRRSSALTHADPYTLIVTLNNNNEAVGTLYIDDGESFEYKKGKYILYSFIYKNDQLVAKLLEKDVTFPTKSWLERVVVVGYKGKAKSAYVTNSKDYETSLDVIHDLSNCVLTIRKPGVQMSTSWTITLKN